MSHAPRHRRTPIVLVTGGKGGVGKTTLVANLGATLARRGARVVLADADLALANLHLVLGLAPRRTLADWAGGRPLAECASAGPLGLRLFAAANGDAGLAQQDPERVEALLDELATFAAADGTDLILVDSPAGIGPDVLALARAADRVLAATTGDPAALTDVYGLVKALGARYPETPTPELVPNLVRDVDEAEGLAGRLAGVCERFLVRRPRMAGWLPAAPRIARSVRAGRPFVLPAAGGRRLPDTLEARCVTALARRLEAGLLERSRSAPARSTEPAPEPAPEVARPAA